MSPMSPDAIAAMPVTPISQPLWNHQYDVLPGSLHSWVPQMHASVPIGDAGYHACSGDASVPYAQGNRGSC